MRELDIKLLWGRAASRCSICRCELSQAPSATSPAFPIGEHAHIVGQTAASPRGSSPLPPEERERYHNRILLCPNHHTIIDKDELAYPIEQLHQLKTDHELWVQDTLGDAGAGLFDEADQLAYAVIIDLAVELCRLRDWTAWTSRALAPIPSWPQDLPDSAEQFLSRVIGAVLPGRDPELEKAIQTLGGSLHGAAQHFLSNAELDDQRSSWKAIRRYKELGEWNPVEYRRLAQEWDTWVDDSHGRILLATRAANWFADEVRRSVNPLFFLREGRFMVTLGPNSDLSHTIALFEFTAAEKDAMPGALVGKSKRRRGKPKTSV